MEPFRIEFQDEHGNVVQRERLREVEGQVGYVIVFDRQIPPAASELHEQGREAGQQGDYAEALEFFARASAEAPEWPFPPYDAAFTHLLNGDTASAEEAYRTVDRLAPRGFFTSKAALDSLRREREGTIADGSYLALVLLEHEEAQAKASGLQSLLAENPAFPAAWNEIVPFFAEAEHRLLAIEKGLAHEPDAATRGSLRIHEALVHGEAGRADDARASLRAVLDDPDCTLANEALAHLVLEMNFGD